MSTIYKCDMCGKEMKRACNRIILIKDEIRQLSGMGPTTVYAGGQPEYDLCSDCYKKIKHNLDNNIINCESEVAEIAEHFGYEQQKNMLIEEQAELIQALNKFDRKGTEEAFNNIIEEMADVELMTDQVKYLLDISQDAIDEIKEEKIKRTMEIVKEAIKASTYGGTH